MDAKTQLGRRALGHAEDALRAIEVATKRKFLKFDDGQPADLDGVVMESGGVISGLYEIKARNMTSTDFFEKYGGEWLLTYDKLVKAMALTKALRLSMVGVLYCIDDKVALVKTLWDANGNLKMKMRVEQTTTQKTVNGGIASRANAYVDMAGAKQFHV